MMAKEFLLDKGLAALRMKMRCLDGRRIPQADRVTVIANNCIGGQVCHDYNLRFNSPFVNLQLSPTDFVKVCGDFPAYMQAPLQPEPITNKVQLLFSALGGGEIDFPVGRIKDVLIYFQHYETFEAAAANWQRRSTRINGDKLYFILAASLERNGEDILTFDALPLDHKLILTTDRPFTDGHSPTACMNIVKGAHFLGRRPGKIKCYYQCFPYRQWLSGNL